MTKSPDSNPLFEAFNRKLDHRFAKVYTGETIRDWVCKNTTLRGQPFSTKGYEFQDAVLNDEHPNMAVIKCSQIGATEVEIRKALAFVYRNNGVSAIFSMPDTNLFRRISQTRIQPLLQKDRVFNLEQDTDSVRSMGIIQIGNSFLYVTSCSESDATSTAADAVFNDELDLSNQKMISLFQSRLQNSDWKINQQFSTPTFQNYGIDAAYKVSDQRQYLQKCECCGHWNWPEFNPKFCQVGDLPNHIKDLFDIDDDIYNTLDLSDAATYVVCEKCRNRLEGEQEWVAKYPGRTNSRGYQITPFATSRITLPYILEQLVKYKRRDYVRGFHNTVLGSTYSDSRTQIPLECIEAAMKKGSPQVSELPSDTPLVIGCDMGQTCHLVVGTMDGHTLLRMEAVPVGRLQETVKELLDNHNIVAGAVDRLPYTPTAETLRDMSKQVIMPVQYAAGKDSDISLVDDSYGDLSHASVNRTKIIDSVANDFRDFAFVLSGYAHQKQIVTEHYRDMVRDEKPEQPAKWVKLHGNDHYFHATALYKAAIQLRPLVQEHQSRGQHEHWGFAVGTIGENTGKIHLPGFSDSPFSKRK